MPNLCILAHCKECQHTERSHSIQGVLVVPLHLEYLDGLEAHEAQGNQKDQGDLFSILLVALEVQMGLFVL